MNDLPSVPIEKCTLPGMEGGATPQEQFTYADVAVLKRVTVQTVMEWVKRGCVPSPVYTGYTARFTADAVADILCGTSAPGTYPVTPSPRSAIGKLGGSSAKPKKGKARNPAQIRIDATAKASRSTRAKPKQKAKAKAKAKANKKAVP